MITHAVKMLTSPDPLVRGGGGGTTLASAPSVRGLVGKNGMKISGGFWQVS